jgi:hypothetical protein
MLQMLVAVVLFTLLALLVAPLWWRRRRISGLPGAHYLEQKCQSLAEEAWRDFRIRDEHYAARRTDPDYLGRRLAEFTRVFRHMIDNGYDNEVRLWLVDLCEREGREAADRAILAPVLAYECAPGRHPPPGLASQALLHALRQLA